MRYAPWKSVSGAPTCRGFLRYLTSRPSSWSIWWNQCSVSWAGIASEGTTILCQPAFTAMRPGAEQCSGRSLAWDPRDLCAATSALCLSRMAKGKWLHFSRLQGFHPNIGMGTFLVVHWLRLCIPNAGSLGSTPGQGTRSHMPQLKDSVRHNKARRSRMRQWRLSRAKWTDTRVGCCCCLPHRVVSKRWHELMHGKHSQGLTRSPHS